MIDQENENKRKSQDRVNSFFRSSNKLSDVKVSENQDVHTIQTSTTHSRSQLKKIFQHTKEIPVNTVKPSDITANSLYENACSFGHNTKAIHPKMRPYIYGSLDGRAIINLDSTVSCLQTACQMLTTIASNGGKFLFVGTKPSIKAIVQSIAEAVGAFYIVEKWKAGTLTNFYTISQDMRRLEQKRKHLLNKNNLTKKEAAVLDRSVKKKQVEIMGILNMKKMPDALIIVDVGHEHIAVKEANKLNIPVFGIVDTNCNPEKIDYPIFSNDDSIKPVKFILEYLQKSIVSGVSKKFGSKNRDYKTPQAQ